MNTRAEFEKWYNHIDENTNCKVVTEKVLAEDGNVTYNAKYYMWLAWQEQQQKISALEGKIYDLQTKLDIKNNAITEYKLEIEGLKK